MQNPEYKLKIILLQAEEHWKLLRDIFQKFINNFQVFYQYPKKFLMLNAVTTECNTSFQILATLSK